MTIFGRAYAHLVILTALLSCGLTACGGSSSTELLQLTDLDPRQIEVGDRIQIVGRDLPAATDIRRITVTLRGMLARPGRAGCAGPSEYTIADPVAGATTVDGATGHLRDLTYAENSNRAIRLDGAGRLEFTATEALVSALTHCSGNGSHGEIDVPHATLAFGLPGAHDGSQGIIVSIDGLTGQSAISGTLRGVSLDVSAPPARRLALEVGASESAQRTLDFLGISLANSNPDDGGLRIAMVRAGSAADEAGIVSNDVLTRINGLTIYSLADFRPVPSARSATLSVLRADVQDERIVSLDGWAPTAPIDLVASAIVLTVLALLLLLFLAPVPTSIAWIRRRIDERRRTNKTTSFAQWLLSRIRAIAFGQRTRDEQTPSLAIAPYLTIVAIASTVVATLFAEFFSRARFDVAVVFVIAQIACWIGQWGSVFPSTASPGASFRSLLRSLISTIPAATSLLTVILLSGTFQLSVVVSSQGGHPWEWNAFRTPMLLIAFVIAFASLLDPADGTSPERHAPRFESWVQHIGSSVEWMGVSIAAMLLSASFLGGWELPGISNMEERASVFLQMLGVSVWMAKSWTLVTVIIWVRWAYPQLQVRSLVTKTWTTWFFVMLTTGAAHLAWMILSPKLPSVGVWAIGVATFAWVSVLVLGEAVRWFVRMRLGNQWLDRVAFRR